MHFYASEQQLMGRLANFIADGLSSGAPAAVIATLPHRQEIVRQLQLRGIAAQRANLTMLDAADALGKFMVGGMPDRDKFLELANSVFDAVAPSGEFVYAFGEMVALLWAGGNTAAAIRLEELWEDFSTTRQFSLYCAYPIEGLEGDNFDNPIDAIVKNHTHVEFAGT